MTPATYELKLNTVSFDYRVGIKFLQID